MHVDMDAFFASVEQRCNPALQGKPIAVVGPGKRTVVAAASYQARSYGVKAAMTLPKAKALCPHIIFVVADHQKYSDTCQKIIKILQEYTPTVEIYSIDESFLDVSGVLHKYKNPQELAAIIKERIKKELGLSCSVGIAPNKLLAKLASEMKKPNGLVTIREEDVSKVLEELPVGELWGIGPKLQASLGRMGIRTCGQLARANVGILRQRFGIAGEVLHCMGLGLDNSPVVPAEDLQKAKSIGHSMTFDKDIRDRDILAKYILELSERVGRRMRSEDFTGKTVSLVIRYSDFFTFSKQRTLPENVRTTSEIYKTALQIFKGLKLAKPVRLVGICVSNLVRDAGQKDLFCDGIKKEKLSQALDKVNDKYGEFVLTYASLLR